MIHKNGIVDKVARHGKAFTLFGDPTGIWYTAFSASQLNGAKNGDEVEFVFQEKVSGGTTFNNIKNDVRIMSHSVGTPVLHSSEPMTPAAVFGAMTISKDRSIARQNACNVAANMLAHTMYRNDTTDDRSDEGRLDVDRLGTNLLQLAKMVEAYTTGDADKAEAMSALEGEGDEG